MAHAQKPDLVFQRNGRVHLNQRGCQFSRLLAAEVCASAAVMVVMLDTAWSEVQCKTTGYPLHSHVSPSLPLPCVTVCHHISTDLYRHRLGISHIVSQLLPLSSHCLSVWWHYCPTWSCILRVKLVQCHKSHRQNSGCWWHCASVCIWLPIHHQCVTLHKRNKVIRPNLWTPGNHSE